MTLDDANRLLALAKANYSYAFKGMTQQEKTMMVQSWAFSLQDIPADIVGLAFMRLLTKCKWLPTVAEIREQVRDMCFEACYENPVLPDTPETRRQKEYIIRNTYALNDGGITLDRILQSPYAERLGSGEARFLPETE